MTALLLKHLQKSCKIFGPKREKVIEDWRNLYNNEVKSLQFTKYYYGDHSMRWMGPAASIGKMRKTYKILVTKPEQISWLGISRCRQSNTLKMS
jgi:hypothetical protein